MEEVILIILITLVAGIFWVKSIIDKLEDMETEMKRIRKENYELKISQIRLAGTIYSYTSKVLTPTNEQSGVDNSSIT